MEETLHEFKVIETDDGFRIEIKGDKERLREFVKWMHPRSRFAGRRRSRGRGFGPFGFFGGRMPFAPPWMWYDEEEDEEDEAEAAE